MKLEDYLMERKEEHQKQVELDAFAQVVELQEELDREEKRHQVLQCALNGGPVLSHPSLSTLFSSQALELLMELAMVEEEIVSLERKVEKLKMSLNEEKKGTNKLEMRQRQWRLRQQRHSARRAETRRELDDDEQHLRPPKPEVKMYKIRRERRASLGSASDVHSTSSTRSKEGSIERLNRCDKQSRNQNHLDKEAKNETPNELSEQLIKCLISIFLKMNQASLDSEGSAFVPKPTISCMNSKNFVPKTPFNCKAPTVSFTDNALYLDPYDKVQELGSTVRYNGPYENFIQITRKSVYTSHVSECYPAMRKLRVLMNELCNVDLTFLTYKQKLAFWINTYNACIMHAFLQYGLPSTQDKLLALMNKAALNVGGIVLNALAIEHFILRHPCDSVRGPANEKEMLLRHAYGLGYPEPNVTFALCRGSWSSPALRVYTPDEVVNELGRAKLEYLEASVRVTSKKKILVPKLLQWHMQDFADNMESLLEWIYSQLPHSGTLKRLMIECLNGETYSPRTKMVEIQPYESEFRYLLPL